MAEGDIDPKEALRVAVRNLGKGLDCAARHAALVQAVEDRGL